MDIVTINKHYTSGNIVVHDAPCFLIYDRNEVRKSPEHWHNAVEIIMPMEDVFSVVCGNTEYILNKKDILIIPPGELHTLSAHKGRCIIMLCDNAMFKDNPALNKINMIASKPLWINSDYDRRFVTAVNEMILNMVRLYNVQPQFSEIVLFQRLISLFIKIVEYREGINAQQNDKGSQIYEMIRKYIDNHYRYEITLDDISKAIGYSKYHLSRLLNSSGSSLFEMISERRIREAETLLNNESLTVTQIAMDVGFTSITTFNRTFRRMKVCTPTQFREMYRDRNTY